jgi:heat shock protein HslJ
MPHLRSSIALSLAAIVALGACSIGTDNASGGLVNTSWTVTSIDGEATAADAAPTMVFAPDGLSGTAGCNSYNATFVTDGDAITITPGAMTAMACDGPAGEQEPVFIEALSSAATWRQRDDGALELQGGATVVAVPADPSASGAGTLESPIGPEWLLVAMDGDEDLGGVVPTLRFAEDGAVDGFAGCNRFSGEATLEEGAVSFGPLASTRMACGAPADTIEQTYLEVLGSSTGWSIDADGNLALEGEAGTLLFAAG